MLPLLSITVTANSPEDMALLSEILGKLALPAPGAYAQEPVAAAEPAAAEPAAAEPVAAEPVAAEQAAEPAKRTRKPKADKPVTETVEAEVPAEIEAQDAPEPVELPAETAVEEPAVDYETAKVTLNTVMSKRGIASAVELLGEFSAARLSDLTPDRYGAFHARGQAMLANNTAPDLT
jgi:hypothetical protein